MIKVLHINTYDTGGAANSCIRLHMGLLESGVSSNLLLKHKVRTIPHSHLFIPKYSFSNRISSKLKRIAKELNIRKLETTSTGTEFIKSRPKGLELFSYPNAETTIYQSKLYHDCDIVNLHWVSGFLDWPSFFKNNKKPVVWTLHDQNPFLGGEHYSERYLGMNVDGKPIPRRLTNSEINEEIKLLDIKRKALQGIQNLHIVSPSAWLLESSKKSELFGKFPHYLIPYGYPINIFKPYNKDFCREVLGIPKDKRVLLFVADRLDNERKGYRYLQRALETLPESIRTDIILCAIGNKTDAIAMNHIIELGKFEDERMMAMAYSAADAFIIPSLEDNLPNTMIESMLCGTPVIGFNTGGIPNAIEDKVTGYLCPEISTKSLYETIERLLANPEIFDCENISKVSKKKYALEMQAEKYIKLYNEIIQSNA